MKTHIRKTIGFMAGELVVPQDFDSMGRARVEADFEARPQYQLKDLLDQCDFTQPASKVDDAWHGDFPCCPGRDLKGDLNRRRKE